MNEIRIPDVGHGLAASHRDNSDTIIQFDCGGSSKEQAVTNGWPSEQPEVLFLSHFHTDHYKGLLELSPNSQRLEKVFIPWVPRSRDSKTFYRALLATDIRVFGERTGSPQGDLVQLLRLLNKGDVEVQSVWRGMTVTGGITEFDILWPPRDFTEFFRNNRKWHKKYYEALKKDPLLSDIDKQIREGKVVEPYISPEGHTIEPEQESSLFTDLRHRFENESITDSTVEIYQTLKSKANRMSMAFRMDTRLLFLGDLNNTDIGRVTSQLFDNGFERFTLMITPHHGTHWDDGLTDINCRLAVSSEEVGRIEYTHLKYNRQFGDHLVTGLSGDFNARLAFTHSQQLPYSTLV